MRNKTNFYCYINVVEYEMEKLEDVISLFMHFIGHWDAVFYEPNKQQHENNNNNNIFQKKPMKKKKIFRKG